MSKVLVLGEVLLRLTPPNNLKISQTSNLDICFGGAEANVAVGLSHLGVNSRILTCLPPNELGNSAKSFLKANSVDCENIVIKGERLGLYYYEEGCSARKANVIYDRKYSSITELRYEDINIDEVLRDVELLHVSGITFGLTDEVRKVAAKVINEAKSRNIKISVDLNYRAKLFNSYEEFVSIMKPIVKDSYLCFGWLSKDVKNFKVLDPSSVEVTDDMLVEQFKYMTDELNVKNVATTLRTGSPYNYHSLTGVLFNGEKLYRSSKYEFSMVSRIGGGDAFAAGAIRGLISEKENMEKIIEFATATAVLKQAQIGDVSLSTIEEVEGLMNNKNLGSVNR
ncbi:sugar kinase [Clostridium chauvoei]|uniref:Sugar kinase n=2 Tax=Clostridium chauvoei TaxID=46867 RepID=A0ABD4RGA5_9CLOT|nr:sugar kinase [Clostridium chauvoei]ATD55783.1 carbohydrate kinase [Clostridium chauvoei]ATD56542.1 carbohydrate kinase [Clostridium chauvoei]MBX7280329.1 sugar kinase [Clostridium chauvoei]MBX7282814.1 sugar kinase [Clostridium chauvoei]MBX7285220.1 sugar kinase [Clostridium chauvoei]